MFKVQGRDTELRVKRCCLGFEGFYEPGIILTTKHRFISRQAGGVLGGTGKKCTRDRNLKSNRLVPRPETGLELHLSKTVLATSSSRATKQ